MIEEDLRMQSENVTASIINLPILGTIMTYNNLLESTYSERDIIDQNSFQWVDEHNYKWYSFDIDAEIEQKWD